MSTNAYAAVTPIVVFDDSPLVSTFDCGGLVPGLGTRVVVTGTAGGARGDRLVRVAHAKGNSMSSGPDLTVAWNTVGGSRCLLEQVVAAFLDECPRLIDDVESSLSDGDVPAVRRAAHSIKCSMRLFRVEPGRAIADRLQRINRCDGNRATDLVAALRAEFERGRRALVQLLDSEQESVVDLSPTESRPIR
jgi:HPt (histidine-containing phosphotransfer) domain-containing protein